MDQDVLEILNKILHSQTSMSEDIHSMKGDIFSMKSDITSLQQDVSSMKGDISSLQQDVSSMKSNISFMKNDISSLQKDVGSMKGDISALQEDVGGLGTSVAKNTILLESTRKDIQIIAEVQKSHYEQNQREHQEMLAAINTRTSTIELAVKSVSTSLGDILEENQSLNSILGRHTVSIETMRRKLAKTL